MGEALPRQIWDRPKQGFTFPWEDWLRGRLRAEVTERLQARASSDAAGLNGRATERLWQAFLARRPGLTWSRVWGLYVLTDWCDRNRVAPGGAPEDG
jgi:asparagine synthase (glutamine-hydrolysing)